MKAENLFESGFLEERRARKLSGESNLGEIELLFGCRNEDSFIYKTELEMFKSDGTLKSFTVAYSQVEPKKYVQDLIEADKARVIFYYTCETSLFESSRPHFLQTIKGHESDSKVANSATN